MNNIRNGISKYGITGLLIVFYLFLLPIQFRTPFGIRFAPADLLFIMLFVVTITKLQIRKYTFSIWHALLLVSFLIATLNGVLSSGILTRYVLIQKDVGLVVLFSLFFIFCQFITNWERMRWVLTYLIGCITFHTLLAILFFITSQLTGITFTWVNSFTGRLSGMLIDPNAFGGLLVVIFTIHITSLYSKNPLFSKRMAYTVTYTLLVGIILTFSRSAWLALSIVLLIQALRNPIYILRIAFISTISLVAIILIAGSDYLQEIIWLATRSSQIDTRLTIIKTGLNLFNESPLFGIGLGAITEKYHIIIHNTPVWILVEFGLIGFTIFLLFLANILWRGAIAFRLTKKGNKPLIYGLMLAFIAMAGLSLGIEALYQRHWWIVMACINSAFMIEIYKKEGRE
ncbi:O-antigen ligase family protein [Lottiidibacillus patelloidae]|nr:O-antigen ligase family protein [Lottiidibacillus patelloidae]